MSCRVDLFVPIHVLWIRACSTREQRVRNAGAGMMLLCPGVAGSQCPLGSRKQIVCAWDRCAKSLEGKHPVVVRYRQPGPDVPVPVTSPAPPPSPPQPLSPPHNFVPPWLCPPPHKGRAPGAWQASWLPEMKHMPLGTSHCSCLEHCFLFLVHWCCWLLW